MTGIDQEIALLRVLLNQLVAKDNSNFPLIFQAIKTLGHLSDIKSGHNQDFTQLKEAVTAVLSEWEIPVPPEKDSAASSDSKNHKS